MKNKTIFIIILTFILVTNVNAKSLYNELKNNSVKDNISSTYVTDSNGIDFLETSSDTNGKGLYMMGETSNESFPIIYYRGDISNNYIIYANFCWQIVRTTSTGGIKIMYAGTPSNNTCNNTGADLAIGKVSYNDTNEAPKYGWTYEENGEEKDSNAKTYLEEWYSNNMTDYTRELEDTIWCNDRRIVNNVFEARTRLEAGNPTLSCEKEDSYTVSSNIGNGKLTYPTGIINADEATYGGEVLKKTQTSAYINIAYSYWSMTPYVLNKNMYPNSKGMLNMYTFTYNAGIRPMVSLRNTAQFTKGDGTNDNPYRVEVEKQYKIIPDEYSEVNTDESEKGKTITITPKERDGYKLVNIQVTDLNGNDIGITVNNNKFTMPEQDVKIKTNYRIVKDSYKVETNQNEIIIDENLVEQDQKASFKLNIPHGYKLLSIKILNSNNEELNIDITENNGIYEFTMPGENVTIQVETEELPKYIITGDDIELTSNEYYESDKVSFKVKEKDGKEIANVLVFDELDEQLDIQLTNKGNCYSLDMPNKNIKVVVEYNDVISNRIINPETNCIDIINNAKHKYPILLIIIISSILLIIRLLKRKEEKIEII